MCTDNGSHYNVIFGFYQDKEEDAYIEWLKDEGKATAQPELEPLREYWQNPKLNEVEKFLRDFILEKKYLDDGGDE